MSMNIFGNRYDLTQITVDGQKYLITNEDYRWLMEKLRLVNKQYNGQDKSNMDSSIKTSLQKNYEQGH